VLIDCTMFNNEPDIFSLRLMELGDVVDWFVVIESDATLGGEPRSFAFNPKAYAQHSDKIVHVKISVPIGGVKRENERRQRDELAASLSIYPDDAVVMFSDVDEIGRADVIRSFNEIANNEIVSTQLDLFLFYLNMKSSVAWFPGPRALRLGTLRKCGNSFDDLRSDKITSCSTRLIKDAGWHFSHMGGNGRVREKVACAAALPASKADEYGWCVANKRSIYDHDIALTVVPDLSHLPLGAAHPSLQHMIYPTRAVEMEGCRRMQSCDMAMHNRLFGITELIHDGLLVPSESTIVEIGSYEGVSTEFFSLFCKQVIAIDPFIPGQEAAERLSVAFGRFQDVLSRRPNIRHIHKSSLDGLRELDSESVDMVYIDGDHGEDSVMKDIDASLRILKPGGCLSGHDYSLPYTINGINRAIGKPDKLYGDTSWTWKKK